MIISSGRCWANRVTSPTTTLVRRFRAFPVLFAFFLLFVLTAVRGAEVVSEDQIPKATKEMFKKLDKQKEKEAMNSSKTHVKALSVDRGTPKAVVIATETSPRKSSAAPAPTLTVSLGVPREGASMMMLISTQAQSTSVEKSPPDLHALALSPRGEKSSLFGGTQRKSSRDSRRTAIDPSTIPVSQPVATTTVRVHKRGESVGMRHLSKINVEDEQRLYKGPTFGVPLAHLMFVGYEEFVIPPILRKTIAFLMKHLTVEGIFRISGSQDEIADWKRRFNGGEPVEFVDGKSSPHDVAGLLKAWLRELPEPLLTFALYDAWMDVAQNKIDRGDDDHHTVERVAELLQKLPEINRAVVTELFTFLRQVAKQSSKNLMTAENIGVVIGPNILSKENQDALTSAIVLPASISLTAFMVKHAAVLFGGGSKALSVVDQSAAPPRSPVSSMDGESSMDRRSTNASIERKSIAAGEVGTPPRQSTGSAATSPKSGSGGACLLCSAGASSQRCSECKKEPMCDSCCKSYVLKSLGETVGRSVCSTCLVQLKARIQTLERSGSNSSLPLARSGSSPGLKSGSVGK